VRIGYVRRGIKFRPFLSAWISEGGSKPARMIGLCPVSPPHFQLDKIVTAIRSYCPAVAIDTGTPDRELSRE
jgi:hypothetical protein